MDRRLEDRIGAGAWPRTPRDGEPVGDGAGYVAELLEYDRVASSGVTAPPTPGMLGGEPMVLVRATDGSRELLVAGTVMHPADGESPERAASEWRERWYRLWKRSALPGKLIAFFNALNASSSPEHVVAAVSAHALAMVGGYKATAFLPDANDTQGVEAVAALRASRLARPGLVVAPDFQRVAERWWGELGPFLADGQIAMVAHVPFGERGVLLVAERRSERVFDSDDWDVLGTVAEQGDRALARVHALETAFELSLTDALTGLANRRQMDVVLKHAWSAAERGEGLAVMMLDLDEFKTLNDTYGHAFGDQILCVAAKCLREEARGADSVVRFGGDEFLVILPRGTAEGARALAGRVRSRLEGWVGISAGVAEYHPTYQSSMELVNAADRDLYRSKARPILARLPEPGPKP